MLPYVNNLIIVRFTELSVLLILVKLGFSPLVLGEIVVVNLEHVLYFADVHHCQLYILCCLETWRLKVL